MNNKRFEAIRKEHPDWSDEQVWTAVSLGMEADVFIDKNGGDIDINDPDILKQIVRKAGEWLSTVLPQIFEKVKKLFSQLLDNIISWAKDNWDKLLQVISRYF
ncbi:MAG: hypothetical protein HDS56_02055 [Barnesiella sp.]|nr:hypothetical protein [Barnesiella sp.]